MGFTRAVAIELGRYGITANTVSPGIIETEVEARRSFVRAMVRGDPIRCGDFCGRS
jgi:NAD(P)-dependent dehydrogenase (short-subunit alcohol dehydrogenase family)